MQYYCYIHEEWIVRPKNFWCCSYMAYVSFMWHQTEAVIYVSGIDAVVKVVDSHLGGWSSIPSKSCSILTVSLSEGLSLCFMCSDQHLKYRMSLGFPLTDRLLLDYHSKQYIHTHTHTHTHVSYWKLQALNDSGLVRFHDC